MHRVSVIDSHTGGEPTRVVIGGGPDLGSGTLAEQCAVFRTRHDSFRSAVVNEPRGSDVLVGALLTPPTEPACVAGVLFFNNVGALGMCGHGMIGVVTTLAHLGQIAPGAHRIETPVGVVTAYLHENGTVSVQNVPSYRYKKAVSIEVSRHGVVTGDIAYGGNWFFLIEEHKQTLAFSNIEALTAYTKRVRDALEQNKITGEDGQEIDHIELFSPSPTPGVDSRNFVLCPGGAYDRSPCGTGTSAKLACLYADGKLTPEQVWRQESIIGSVFAGTISVTDSGGVLPTITGRAYVTAEATLLLDPTDPFCFGIR